eukprot:GHVN01001920.1.p1 GENE.GHVN01001920.1~~GHVN01001920.1.p1  ORF type:complete len:1227 (+),score=113.86 GHVN01001920.1:3-3683(+)
MGDESSALLPSVLLPWERLICEKRFPVTSAVDQYIEHCHPLRFDLSLCLSSNLMDEAVPLETLQDKVRANSSGIDQIIESRDMAPSQINASREMLRGGFECTYSPDYFNFCDRNYTVKPDCIRCQELGTWSDFVRQLICILPLRLVRCADNKLVPIVSVDSSGPGSLQHGGYGPVTDFPSCFNSLDFGLVDVFLMEWTGEVRVVSSMGLQSTGKSHMLNHLMGTSFDISGARCTEGAWMGMRILYNEGKSFLVVVLDFEGLGSFERSAQEDVLLSLLNTAISQLTIYRCDQLFGRDAEATFTRIQQGVGNIREQEGKLFQGRLVLAIKDINDNIQAQQVCGDFGTKIGRMLKRHGDKSFSHTLFDGRNRPINVVPFNGILSDKYFTVLEKTLLPFLFEQSSRPYRSGEEFIRYLKLVVSKLIVMDWQHDIDGGLNSVRCRFVITNMNSAISTGTITADSEARPLTYPSSQPIDDAPTNLEGPHWVVSTFASTDYKIQLCDVDASGGITISQESHRKVIKAVDESLVPIKNMLPGDVLNHTKQLTSFLVARRVQRLKYWVSSNLLNKDIADRDSLDTGVASMEGEALSVWRMTCSLTSLLEQKWSICQHRCEQCFYLCRSLHSHDGKCDCLASCHICDTDCSFCTVGKSCSLKAGHAGSHSCGDPGHVCHQQCSLIDKSRNCEKVCNLEVGHASNHMCAAAVHLCKLPCSLEGCANLCKHIQGSHHERHECVDTLCPEKCALPGCQRKCCESDHFHHLTGEPHQCGEMHICQAECEIEGICQIDQQLVTTETEYLGRRQKFSYTKYQQNGRKLQCTELIPLKCTAHSGPHVHTRSKTAVHHCSTKCPTCGYFCNKPFGHNGRHDCKHGNMMDNYCFASSVNEFSVGHHEYEKGESAKAEMCSMMCSSPGLGRGHIHFMICTGTCSEESVPSDSGLVLTRKHVEVKTRNTYGLPQDKKFDMVSHDEYWRSINWEDPYTVENRRMFQLCGARCRTELHRQSEDDEHYCLDPVMHRSPDHTVPCTRNKKAHVMFLIDNSSSMNRCEAHDMSQVFGDDRLGCAMAACHGFLQRRLQEEIIDWISLAFFDNEKCEVVLTREPATSTLMSRYIVPERADIHESYTLAFRAANNMFERCGDDRFVIIFLTDGYEQLFGTHYLFSEESLGEEVARLNLHRVEVFCVGFGIDDLRLQTIAQRFVGGQYFSAKDAFDLGTTFIHVAECLNVGVFQGG